MTKIFETADISKIQDEYRTSEKFDNFKAIVENIKSIQNESWKYLYEHKNDLEGIFLYGDYLGLCTYDFSDANFKNSFLNGVRFDYTQLRNANFSGSTFFDVSFADATLDGADFRGVKIDYVYRPLEFFEPMSSKGLLLKDAIFGNEINSGLEQSNQIKNMKKTLKDGGAIFS
jgi:uncharacterized protein YjbI with pentapeptide repeats